jgi:hypothetical protein
MAPSLQDGVTVVLLIFNNSYMMPKLHPSSSRIYQPIDTGSLELICLGRQLARCIAGLGQAIKVVSMIRKIRLLLLTMGRVQHRACWPLSAQVATNESVSVGNVGAAWC